MALNVEFVLEAVSFALIERVLVTTLPGGIAAGVRTIAIVDESLYVGAQLLVGPAGSSQEVVTVSAITVGDFTATFANAHNAGEPVRAATFPSGRIGQALVGSIATNVTGTPLFSQSEMLKYFSDTQNDFLERTRMVYAINNAIALLSGNPVASLPADCIRPERVDIAGQFLWPVSRRELSLTGNVGQNTPNSWYEDETGTGNFGVDPRPGLNLTAELIYSQKGSTAATLKDLILVPFPFWPYLKYGILEKAWNKEGETRDPRRAAYCAKRYSRGAQIAARWSRAIQVSADYSKQMASA